MQRRLKLHTVGYKKCYLLPLRNSEKNYKLAGTCYILGPERKSGMGWLFDLERASFGDLSAAVTATAVYSCM